MNMEWTIVGNAVMMAWHNMAGKQVIEEVEVEKDVK